MESSFNKHEIPDILLKVPTGEQVRCPFDHPVYKDGSCNKLLFNGKASEEAQEFHCPTHKKIIVQRMGDMTIFQRNS